MIKALQIEEFPRTSAKFSGCMEFRMESAPVRSNYEGVSSSLSQ